MPNIKSAIKRTKQAEEHRVRNAAEKSRVRTAHRNFLEAVESGDKEVGQKAFNAYCSMLDKAAKRGAVKGNAADRSKARAAARLAAVGAV